MKKGTLISCATGILAIGTLGIGIYNLCVNDTFLEVSIAQVLTLLVAIMVAFWATQYKNDQRSAKAHAEKVIIKIQALVSEENFYTFTPGAGEEDAKKNFALRHRKIANCLTVLKDYSKQFGFEKEVEYIDSQFLEYREFVSEKLQDFNYLHASEAHLRRLSENIDSKCDQIVVKFYK